VTAGTFIYPLSLTLELFSQTILEPLRGKSTVKERAWLIGKSDLFSNHIWIIYLTGGRICESTHIESRRILDKSIAAVENPRGFQEDANGP